MLFSHDTDVLVVGAGPVGLMSALMLAERGVSVEVIDEEASTERHNYAVQLHPSALELLDDAGLAPELLSAGIRVDTMEFYDERVARASLRFADLRSEFPYMLVLSRNVLEATLEQALKARKVPVSWWHRLSDLKRAGDHVAVEVERMSTDPGGYSVSSNVFVVDKVKHKKPQFVIGADGFHSAVRRRADIGFAPVGPALSFAPVEFKTDIELGNTVRVVFSGDSTSVLWPLPDGNCRWVFQLGEEHALSADSPLVHVGTRTYPSAPRSLIDRLLAERAPWFKGRIEEVNWAAQVRFEPGLAHSFGSGRLWLAGDSAHVTGPVGIQSLNSGLHEAHDLGSRLARVMRTGETPDLLERYGQERTTQWKQLLGLTPHLVPMKGADPWIVAHADRLRTCIPALGRHYAELADQLGFEFKPART